MRRQEIKNIIFLRYIVNTKSIVPKYIFFIVCIMQKCLKYTFQYTLLHCLREFRFRPKSLIRRDTTYKEGRLYVVRIIDLAQMYTISRVGLGYN